MTTTLFQLKKNNQIQFFINTKTTPTTNRKTEKLTAISTCLDDIINDRKPTLSYDIVYNYISNLCYSPEGNIIEQITSIVDSTLTSLSSLTKQRLVIEPSLTQLHQQYIIFSKKLALLRNLLLPYDRISNKDPLILKAFGLFREVVLSNNTNTIIDMLIVLINTLRGSNYDNNIVSSLVRMMFDCNLQNQFKDKLLKSTSEFYSSAAQNKINETLEDYLNAVKSMFDREEHIAQVHYPTMKIDTVAFTEKELMTETLPLILVTKLTQLKQFIAQQKTHSILLFISLGSRVKKDEDIQKALIGVIVTLGKEFCSEKDEKIKINKIFSLYDYLSQLEKQAPMINTIIKISFEKFISSFDNDVAIALVKFADRMLRKGGMNQLWASKILQIFKFLNGKDTFEQHYQLLLSKRLLYKGFQAEDEKIVLEQLRQECGNSYTFKLEEMVKDVETGKGWYQALNKEMSNNGMNGQYGMVVINGTSWPACPTIKCISLPKEIEKGEEVMRKWYIKEHPNRKVDFNPLLGIVSVKAHCFGGIEITMNVLQFEILTNCEGKTIKELKSKFEGEDDILMLQIKSLMGKEKLICVQSFDGKIKKPEEIKEEDVVMLNSNYHSNKPKIKINTFQTKESKEEKEKVDEKIVKDRETRIDAVVVRVMKKEKKMTVSELLTTITPKLDFKPDVEEIKQRIDKLIEREYLEKDEKDENVLLYLA
ncbi:cullin-4B, putative [Entamoeba dispar SAW760]|uniref:Cullin-4B, putative n=1 Tax=Entamoeba dispar (strain ATCC PRA-260 / SAW760) TaxID=370354 RepID=B0ESZ4_ENTDS|nr:cullin-4B, putative [Entamoeba dispar SAW760]EDR22357.1 cullin-4B, putative [Entamoeba dispar SAW760]|eukprot:EDR22357.1 cullin-4B, putative [Entamoeba dispar SAW760]